MDMDLKNKLWLKQFVIFGILILLFAGCSVETEQQTALLVEQPPYPTLPPTPEPTPEWERAGWTLIWADEFDGEAHDPSKWVMEIGGHGWGNNEKQFYTDLPENVRLEDGQLVIEARNEFFVRRHYTSGRIKTQGLFSFTYGRVEARMKLPYGNGIWPAFWMLGEDIDLISWPSSGEIDIMEHIGREPTRIYGTVHGPGYSGSGGVGHFTTFPAGSLSEEFHTYAIEWEPNEIRWYVDDQHFFTLTPEQVPGEWVFDKPYFILINLAVGGYWPGDPDETTVFPQFLLVDHVRVYQRPDMVEVFQP
jgi:beta-glucanase (GH16 family)